MAKVAGTPAFLPKQHVRISNGCLKGSHGGCEIYGTPTMKHQLFYAVYNHQLNAIQLELTLAAEGQRDDRSGRKFQFWFPERGLSF